MKYKKLKADIVNQGLTKLGSYSGVSPIQVNNNTSTISFDSTSFNKTFKLIFDSINVLKTWKEVSFSIGTTYSDFTFTVDNNVSEVAFSGKIQDSSGYYAFGGIYPLKQQTLFIPVFKQNTGLVFAQLINNDNNNYTMRFFDTSGRPYQEQLVLQEFPLKIMVK